jgi:hypothetical protein
MSNENKTTLIWLLFLAVKISSHNWSISVSEWVSEWLLFKANYAILQLYLGIDKLILNMDYAENYKLSN